MLNKDLEDAVLTLLKVLLHKSPSDTEGKQWES